MHVRIETSIQATMERVDHFGDVLHHYIILWRKISMPMERLGELLPGTWLIRLEFMEETARLKIGHRKRSE